MAFEDGKALEIFLNSNFGVKMECLWKFQLYTVYLDSIEGPNILLLYPLKYYPTPL